VMQDSTLFLGCGYLVFPVPFVEKAISSPIEWSWHPRQKSFDHNMWELFYAF
jgi:hypothetical protein